MDMHQEHDHTSHHEHNEHSGMDHSMHMGNLKLKFFVSLVLSLPIILFSPMMGMKLPFQISFSGSPWLVLIFSTILFFYGGMPFLKGAKMELEMKAPAMMTLISLGITVAYIYSLYAFFINHILKFQVPVMDFFWELATLIVIMLLGHWLEMNAIKAAGNALEKIAALLPKTAYLLDKDNNIEEMPLTKIKQGDSLLVKPGDSIPTDGVIIEGETSVNESMITGEAKEVIKSLQDKVIGGTINGSGTIHIKVTGTGKSGYLAQVMDLVKKAQKEKSKTETLSDKVAGLLFYIALIVGIITFIFWFLLSDLSTALERMVTVLVIACPHALGLAIPLVSARSTSLGAKNGLLIQNREALELTKDVTTMMFDKTGTLTKGNFSLLHYSDENTLKLMAALEKGSNHPLAISISKKAKELNLELPHATALQTLPGIGITGNIQQVEYKIVSPSYAKEANISYNKAQIEGFLKEGNTISILLKNENYEGFIAQGDEIKSEAKEMITEIKSLGITPVMLTGDQKIAGKKVAKAVGINHVYAELKPEDKAS
ncbi:MAG TPA: copper-translocating P-type ATPase, partial [Candidatus Dorea intestinavium]|nr:copper-translocating P-type ATPase [Candidatus Dorea intestinavium]